MPYHSIYVHNYLKSPALPYLVHYLGSTPHHFAEPNVLMLANVTLLHTLHPGFSASWEM